MALYVTHRAVLYGEIRCRRAEARDRQTVEELLSAVPTKRAILTDFERATDRSRLDLDCFVFECDGAMLGLAVLWLFTCTYIIDARGGLALLARSPLG